MKKKIRNSPRLFVRIALCASVLTITSVDLALAQAWRLEPIIKVGGEFDDNATLDIRTDAEVELQGYLLDLRADITYSSPKSSFFVQPRFLLRSYPDEPDFDSDDIFVRSNYRFQGISNTLGFRANYEHQSVRTAERIDSDLEIEDPDEITDIDTGRLFRFGTRDLWRISPYWKYQMSNISSIGADFDYVDATYEDVFAGLLTDFSDARLNLNYRRSLSDVTTGVVTLTGRTYSADDGLNDIESAGALVGVERELSEETSVTAMIGLEDVDQVGPDTDPEVVGRATLVRNLETIRLFVQYRRSISASGASRLSIRDTINLNFRRRLSEKIAAGLGVRAYRDSPIGETTIEGERNYIQLQSSFVWYLTSYFAIEADYRYTVIDRGGIIGESSNSNRVNLWFVYQPRTVPKL